MIDWGIGTVEKARRALRFCAISAVLPVLPIVVACGKSNAVDPSRGTIDVVLAGRSDLSRWSGVELTLEGPAGAATLRREDFALDENEDLRAGPFSLGGVGQLVVAVVLTSGTDTVANGAVGFELTDPRKWVVAGFLTNGDPTFECGACVTADSVGLAAEFRELEGEALWLVLAREP